MTVAVCLKCGAMKHGALTPCQKCRHLPQDPDDQARHIITSDHYFSRTDLDGIASRIQNGLPLHFDPKQVEEFAATINTPQPNDKKLTNFARLFVTSFYGLLILAIVVGIYLIAKFVLK